jgi:hypothetical protein
MKVEQAKQIASNAVEQLRQALEAGHSERLKEYLAAMARFRRCLHKIWKSSWSTITICGHVAVNRHNQCSCGHGQ